MSSLLEERSATAVHADATLTDLGESREPFVPELISKPVTSHRSSSAILPSGHARNLNLALLQLYVARSPHSRIELQQRDFYACLRQRRLAILY